MKRAAWCSLFLAAGMVTTACGPASPPPSQRQAGDAPAPALATSPKGLVIAIKGEPEHFIFDFGSRGFGSVGAADLQLAVHQGLTVNDERGNVLPMLATDLPSRDRGTWLIRPDGTMQTTYRLKPNVTWHDGTPLTSKELLFGWTVEKDPELPISGSRSVANLIDRIETPDVSTLVLEWSKTYPFAHAIQMGEIPALPSHLLEPVYRADKERFIELPYWKREFVGLGPYELAEWEPGSHLVLKAYDRFYAGRPKIETITARFIPSQPTIVANLLAGAIDGVINRSLDFEQAMLVKEEWERAGKKPVAIAQPTHWRMIPFQFREPRLREMLDVRARRAMVHAVDRQAVVDAMFAGQSPVSHTFITADDVRWDGVKDVVNRYDYDPRRALDLLAEVGWQRGSDGSILSAAGEQIRFRVETSAVLQQTATITIPFWKAIGFEVEQVVLSPGDARDVRRVVQFPTLQISNIPLAFQHNLERLHGARCPSDANRWTGFNSGCYRNPENDRVADALRIEIDTAEQTRLWRELVKIQTEDVPVVPMFFLIVVTLFRDGVTGVKGEPKPRGAQTWNVAEWDVG